MKIQHLFSLILVLLSTLTLTLFSLCFVGPSETLAAEVKFNPKKWPIDVGASVNSSPILGDLDGDGILEIVVGADNGKVYTWKADGTALPGWPVSTGDSVRSSPALADLDGDGKLEVMVGSFDGKLYAWNFRGNLIKGWPTTTGSVIYSSPAIGDVDGDQAPEVVVGSFDNKVYVWNADGTLLRGWPQSTGLFVYSSPALADLDRDGKPEIIVGSDSNQVFVWNGEGKPLPGWPQVTGHVVPTSPAIGDIDGDGDLDIIVGSWDKVYVWNSRGELKRGWPIVLENWVTSSPALADLNNDGLPDVIIGAKDGKVYAWDTRGQVIDGWPTITDGEVASSPAVGDVDGDGRLDVVVGSKDGRIYIWDVNGKLLPGWPQATTGAISSSPAIGDLDKDGTIEVVVGSKDHKVYVWSIPRAGVAGTRPSPGIPWASFHRNPQRTGFYSQLPIARRQLPVAADQRQPTTDDRHRTADKEQESARKGPVIKREEPEKPRVVGKEIIEDLSISDFTDTTVTLTWTAPRVKENPAKFYDIRFSTEPISEKTWDKAAKYTTDLHPSSPNQKEVFTLMNLPNREKLYIALRASDGKEKTKLSNVVQLDRPDTVPPGSIKDLVIVEKDEQLELSWTAPGDNEYEGTATAYDIRYATIPLNEASWLKATEIIGEPKPLPAGSKQQFLIPKPPLAETLYFGIKTIDESLNFSPLSNIATWTPPDRTPPAKIQDLKVESITREGIILTWTAPGDDGNVGRAFRYDIRYSESPITESNWSSIKNLVIGPIPEVAGTLQRFLIRESFADKIYYFAMKAVDERGNESPLSNVLQVDTRDKIAPAPVKDLVVMEVGADWARLSWTASGDDGTEGTASAYSIKYARDPETLRAWDKAQEVHNPSRPLPSGSKEEFILSGLKSNIRYYIGLKVIDDQGNYSALSNIVEVKTSDTLSPGPIVDLRVTGSTEDSITLSWTATGDDGRTGQAAEYDLRYTVKDKLTKNKWDQARKVTELPHPAEAGKPEMYMVRNLSRDTVYYFAIEAVDKQGNRSGLSNILEVSTADITPPATVQDLAIVGTGADWVRVTWTATGDDGMEGRASFYSLRYAESSQTVREWDRALEVPNIIKPGNSGNKEEFLITGLKSNTIYYIALRVGDDRGNLSGLSNMVQARTADTINPAPIADLKVTGSTEDSVTLSWMATGDDGWVGKAAAYDLRFSMGEKLTKENWPLAHRAEGLPRPAEAGSPETFSVTGLIRGTLYYFAIEAIDSQGNRSGLSNVVEVATKDVTPPASITDLSVVRVTADSVELNWAATGDDGVEGRATTYVIKYALDRKTLEEWNKAIEVFHTLKPAKAGEKESFTLTGLKSNTVYYIGLKVIDDQGNISGLSNIAQAKTPDTINPDPIGDLRVVASTESSITLNWTATGDDGRIGKAASYDLRYTAQGKLTKDNWSQARRVTGLPQPAESGKTESFTVTGLSKNLAYYFAIEAIDGQGNRSGLSNVVEVSTADITPPATVQNLEVVGTGADWIRITWIATGDDGMEGKAASYSLRYAETAQAIRNWDQATEVTNMIRPGHPGEKEEFIISGLNSNSTYYIGLKVQDDRGNTSGLSTIVQARTSDAISPGAIVDLRVVGSTEDSITLGWTATGDDGRVGQASEYDLRYTVGEKLTKTSWKLAQQVSELPRPQPSGSPETYKVSGLRRDTVYYFGLEAVDGQGNRSGISNILEASTRDLTPPGRVVDLAVVGVGADWVKVSWTATGDDGAEGQAGGYSLRYAEDVKVVEEWGPARQVLGVPKPSQPGTREEFTITGLNSNTLYYIGLKVLDNQNNASRLSNILQTRTADALKPALITDLAPMEVTETTITLRWTATGDDGKVGRAERYDLRYVTGESLTAKTWQSATLVPNLPRPSEFGTVEVVTIPELSRDTKYHFAIEAIDSAGNRSGLSNIVETMTPDRTPPAPVTDLRALEVGSDWVRLSWTATGDDGNEGTASQYSLRYATDLKTLRDWEKAVDIGTRGRVLLPKDPGTPEEFILKGLKSNTTYYLGLKVIDNRQNYSGLSNVVEVRTADALNPGAIVDLRVVGSTEDSITLGWTATGDDGRVGQASEYDLRYTVGEKLTKTSWKLAQQVSELPRPQPSGSPETYKVSGLRRDTVYYFGLEAVDGQGNRSGISNILEASTRDLTPPGRVVDLAVVGVGADWVKVSWTATGDDGAEGQAGGYSLRYAEDVKVVEEWGPARQVLGVPKPSQPGTREEFTVTGLKNNSTYYMALKVMDNRQNLSPLSNILKVQTADTLNPAPVTDLRAVGSTTDTVTLAWTATGDDDRVGHAAQYDLRYTTIPSIDKTWASARKVVGVPAPAEAGTPEKFMVRGLAPNQIYYFALMAIDKSGNASLLSNTAEASTTDTVAPRAIFDLSVEETNENSVSLAWTAVGDDLIHKTAAAYDLRYSTNPITEANWSQAAKVSQALSLPKEPGAVEEQVVTHLRKGVLYYFAIKSIDQASNVSPISNVVRAYTLPARVTDLTVGGFDGNNVTLTWTTPGGDLTRGERFYEIRYAKQEITEDNWSQATPYPAQIKAKNPGSEEKVTLTKLPPDEKLFFAVKISNGVSISQVSNYLEVNRADIIPPAAITDLTVRAVSCLESEASSFEKAEDGRQKGLKKRVRSFLDRKSDDTGSGTLGSELQTLDCLELFWTATGDNGNEGTAMAYDIRYTPIPLTETNWTRAEQYTNEPVPQVAGTREVFIVPLPSREETFYFAIKVLDEALNISPISNVAFWTPIDQIPPSAITDLKVTKVDSHSVTLSWTAPGNNENRGQAAFYDLRYSESRSTLEGWSRAQTVTGEPLPEVAGTPQSLTLKNLASDTTYYIALKAIDEAKNISPISNIVEVTTLDLVAPSPVKDLSVVSVGTDWLKLGWTATGDDGEVGQASQYSLKYVTDRAALETWDSTPSAGSRQAIEVPNVPKPKAAGKREEFVLTGLTHNTTYYIGLKAIDNRGNYSGLSNILEAQTGDAVSPERISDLKIVGRTGPSGAHDTGLTLSWTAPGDDGNVGRADKYEIRYSTDPMDANTWRRASKVRDVPKPSDPGTLENVVIRGLAPNQKYYFGVIAMDKAGNASPLSNIAEGFTLDTIPPQAVGDLRVEKVTKDSVTLTWTSPGDDALHDQPFAYDIRYSRGKDTFLLGDEVNWEVAEKIQGIPQPGKAGTLERFTVKNLVEDTPYYFALKVIDYTGNISPLSNIASTQTKDVTPPDSIGDLVAAFPTRNTITLIWTAPQDPNPGRAVPASRQAVASYDIRYWEIRETEFPEGSRQQAVGRTIGGQGSPGTEVGGQGIPGDAPPSKIDPPGTKVEGKKQKPVLSSVEGAGSKATKNTKAKSTGNRRAADARELEQPQRLKPGDLPVAEPNVKEGDHLPHRNMEIQRLGDEKAIPVSSRRSVPVSQATTFPWEKAFRISTPPRPANPGSLEKYVVANLRDGQTYAFAIRSIDQSGNTSELSNMVVETTLGRGDKEERVSGSGVGWNAYQGKGTIISEDGTGIRVTSTSSAFGVKQPMVVSYPAGNNTVALPQDQLSLRIKSRDPFIVYVKVVSAPRDEYYLAYMSSPLRYGDPETQGHEEAIPTSLRPHVPTSPTHRVDNFVFFRLGPVFLDGTWHSLERNLRQDLFSATGQNYLETTWFAVRGTSFSLGDINLAGKLVKTISINQGWSIHYGEGDLRVEQDSELNDQILQAKSRTGRDLVVAYPSKPGIQITEKFLATKIKAGDEFKFFVKVMTTSGETYYLAYVPREGDVLVSGNYIYVPLGSSYRDGTWRRLERDLEADLKKALEAYGQSGANYSYTSWISIGGKEFSLDDIEFSTEKITAKIPK